MSSILSPQPVSSSAAAILSQAQPVIVRKPLPSASVTAVGQANSQPAATQQTRVPMDLEAHRPSLQRAPQQPGRMQVLYQMTGENWKVSGVVGTATAIAGIALLGVAGNEYDSAPKTAENIAGVVLLLGGAGIDAISAFGPKKPDTNGSTRHPLGHVPAQLGLGCLDVVGGLAPCLLWTLMIGGAIGGSLLLTFGSLSLNDENSSLNAPGAIAGGAILTGISLTLFTVACCCRPKRSGAGVDDGTQQEAERQIRDWNQAISNQNQYQTNYQNMIAQGYNT